MLRKNLVQHTLESLDLLEPSAVVPPQVDAAPPDADELEAIQHEMEQDVAESQRVEDLSIGLEALYDAARNTLEADGGLNHQGELFVSMALEQASRLLGTEHTKPAMESAMLPSLRTRLTLESIAEKIKSVIDQMIEFVKRIWEHIVNFFKGLLTQSGRLRKRAQGLLSKIEIARKGNYTAAAKTVDVAPYGTYHDFTGLQGVTGVVSFLEKMITLGYQCAERGMATSKRVSDLTVDMMQKSLKEETSSTIGIQLPVNDTAMDATWFKPSTASVGGQNIPHKGQHYSSPRLPGDRVITVVRENDGHQVAAGTTVKAGDDSDLVKALDKYGQEHWSWGSTRSTGNQSANVEVMQLQHLEELAVTVIQLCDNFDKINREADEQNRANENRIKALTPLAAKVSEVFDGDLGTRRGKVWLAASRAYMRVQRNYMRPAVAVYSYLLHAGDVYMHYGNQCIEQYHAPKAA